MTTRLMFPGLMSLIVALASPQAIYAYPTITTSTGPTNPAPNLPELMPGFPTISVN
ncbi:hypothetical protein H6G89_03825 [Oscillatoria sp. FACHB-1407]|uniref:hypothetical protein n=1 Tax=Oscillatoria sp. FACHB-1407 TaxID=2692847 RepID=UPI0016865785|nr:hypothetical protein [Oscillatoria sp. FACHB-1407]MBD2460166.1 hypothetical protein [Oscillatoria sp. FACHB-1407]